MLDASILAVVRSNPQLFSLVYRFNCQPARFVHPDHVQNQIAPELFERLVATDRGERKLSQWIIHATGITRQGDWDFREPRRRLALLDWELLALLIRYAGAAAYRQKIAQVIDRQQLVRLKQSLGQELYLFAVKRAAFLVKDLPEWLSESPLSLDADRDIARAGQRCLGACLTNESRCLLERLELKLPHNVTLQMDESVRAEDRERIWQMLKRILLTELQPGLAPCFN